MSESWITGYFLLRETKDTLRSGHYGYGDKTLKTFNAAAQTLVEKGWEPFEAPFQDREGALCQAFVRPRRDT